jgi:hypothetical protein
VDRTIPFYGSCQSRPPTRPDNWHALPGVENWGLAWRRSLVGEFECRGGVTFMVEPLVPCSNLHTWARS